MRRFRSIALWLLKGWLLALVVFGLMAALVAVQRYTWYTSMLNEMPRGRPPWLPQFTWTEEGRLAFRDWLPWIILAPFLFQLVARLPLFGGRTGIAAPAHLMSAMATFALLTWWSESVLPRRSPDILQTRGGRPLAGWVETFIMRILPEPPPDSRTRSRPEPPKRSPLSQYFFVFAFRLPLYLAVLSAAHALHFYRRSQARERHGLELEAGLARARLEALQMQLQPHFLFNSLNAIAALIHQDPEAADEMVAALSDFLRLTLESRNEQELPLRRELEFVERYLAIEKVRFGDRLRFSIDTPAETLPALVPALVLQPLVENAVRHGLEPKLGGGALTITARREEEQLVLTVSDDGAGFGGHAPREGIGLVNTRARLGELYGETAQLEMRNGDGVEVRITLPFHTVDAAHPNAS